jgi:integrase
MSRVLTQRAVDAAKPRMKRFGLPDKLIPGLQLLTQPTGHRSYVLYARLHGRQIKLLVGNAGILTLGEAREQARRLLVAIARGEDPRVSKREALQPAPETFATTVARFLARHVKVHNRSWRATERILERSVLPRWGNRPLGSITRVDVISLLDGIADRAPVMANRVLAAIRKLFNWCIERGLIEHSPCERVRAPSREVARDRTPSDDELRQIWQAADTLGYPFGPCIQMLILTGARRSEVGGMRWSEIDPTLTTWTLPKERAKNGVAHVLPLSTAAREILQALPRFDGSDFVFTLNGATPIRGFARFKVRLDAAIDPPLAPWCLHDLRRAVASGMAKLGVALPVIEKVLNHTSGSFRGVVGVYQRHDFAAEKAAALEAWGRHVVGLTCRRREVMRLRAAE